MRFTVSEADRSPCTHCLFGRKNDSLNLILFDPIIPLASRTTSSFAKFLLERFKARGAPIQFSSDSQYRHVQFLKEKGYEFAICMDMTQAPRALLSYSHESVSTSVEPFDEYASLSFTQKIYHLTIATKEGELPQSLLPTLIDINNMSISLADRCWRQRVLAKLLKDLHNEKSLAAQSSNAHVSSIVIPKDVSTKDLTIRSAEVPDVPTVINHLRACFEDLAAHYVQVRKYLKRSLSSIEKKIIAIDGCCTSSKFSCFWVAELPNVGIVGCVAVSRTLSSSPSECDHFELQHLTVNSEVRSMGIGTKLIATVVKAVMGPLENQMYQDLKARSLHLTVLDVMEAARRQYVKAGFQEQTCDNIGQNCRLIHMLLR